MSVDDAAEALRTVTHGSRSAEVFAFIEDAAPFSPDDAG